ncbi:TRAP-type C4-dicarboxylate transport system substrate-binding protein [Ancylobacter aquaticus]|uniref:TRAP-type C4-dicarboxylate transport system substrate-binding protein n=1 Tax=Ancylobacter aquaticus TaxID=100 RepID=A0A4R1IGZ6_ANCAQ|nr:TRAP transporter substrate-binding protein [Ancylobacter aquaticus]TCK30652.1 TRAP-type C4-dicarboxylate transport system substrate-binding protein [Ancylobacter aquaticus]
MISRRNLLAAAAAGAALPLAAPGVLRAQTRDLRLGLITPPGHPWNTTAQKIGEVLKEKTGGKLTMTVFHAGQLGNEGAMMQQLQTGALDLAFLQAAEVGNRVPNVAAILAPYVVRSTEACAKLVRQPIAMRMLEPLPKETGTIGLAWGITTIRVVMSAKEITGISGLNGMKLRINTTPAFRDFYSLLGAAPTPIPTPQVFDALANGQVDGLEADLDLCWNQRFDKVSKVLMRMNAVFMPMVALASGRAWQSLSSEDRALITAATKEALDIQIDNTVTDEPKLLKNFEGTEIKIIVPPEADAAPIIAEYDKIWTPKAPILPELRKIGATLG